MLICMTCRTTLNLDQQLVSDAKQLAQNTQRTLTAVIEEALREKLLRANRPASVPAVGPLFTSGRSQFHPDVDFSDNAALKDFMDEADGHSGR